MTRESTKENKPASLKALFLKPIRQWLNRRSPDSQLSSPIIQHPNNGLSVTMDDISTDGRKALHGSDEHFKRSARARMSLPIMQQNEFRRQAYSQLQIRGQQQARSMGHIYLQHKGETKQANLPNELTTVDTIRALFVCAFPNMLSMEYMSQPNVKIYIYSPSCNLFYELRNIDEVRHESVLRVFQTSDTIPALPPQHYSMRLLPPIPQQQHPLSLSQQHHHHQQQHLQQQLPLRRTPIQQAPPHSQHQVQAAPHQISPHLQIPPPKPRRMIPVMNGMNGMNNLNGIGAGLNGLYHNGGLNGLRTTNQQVSSNNLIYMAPPQTRRTTPSPWLPPSQI